MKEKQETERVELPPAVERILRAQPLNPFERRTWLPMAANPSRSIIEQHRKQEMMAEGVEREG